VSIIFINHQKLKISPVPFTIILVALDKESSLGPLESFEISSIMIDFELVLRVLIWYLSLKISLFKL